MVRTTRFAPKDSRNDKRFKGLQTRKNLTTPRTLGRVLGAVVTTPRKDGGSAAGKNGLVDMFENLTF